MALVSLALWVSGLKIRTLVRVDARLGVTRYYFRIWKRVGELVFLQKETETTETTVTVIAGKETIKRT